MIRKLQTRAPAEISRPNPEELKTAAHDAKSCISFDIRFHYLLLIAWGKTWQKKRVTTY